MKSISAVRMSLYRGLLREAVLHHRSLEEFNELLSGQGLCVCDNSGRGLSLHIFFFVLRFFLRRGLSLSLGLFFLRLSAGGAESRVVRDLLAAGRAESLAAVLRDLGLYLLYDVLLLVDLKDLRRDESRVSLLVRELSESGKQPLSELHIRRYFKWGAAITVGAAEAACGSSF